MLLRRTIVRLLCRTRATVSITTTVSLTFDSARLLLIVAPAGPNGGNAKGPRFFQLYMGHDDEITISLLERAWKSGFDVLMLTTDTWQLGWRPTDINIANYM